MPRTGRVAGRGWISCLSWPVGQVRTASAGLRALIRSQLPYPSRHRIIVALDIERSTSWPDPVKGELRTMLYELFDAALRSAGVNADRRDRFIDRGDGLLALIDPAGQALVLNRVVPVFSQLLTGYNTPVHRSGRPAA